MTIELLQPIDASGQVIPAGKTIKINDLKIVQLMIQRGIGRAVSFVNDNESAIKKNELPKDDITPSEIIQSGSNSMVIWRNPYPHGTPEARRVSLQEVINAMLYGLPPTDDEQSRHIKNIVQDILAGKAKLEDLRHLLGQLH